MWGKTDNFKEVAIQKLRINRQIRAFEVRLIDEDGKQIGIVPLQKALEIAEEKGLDLVEVAPFAKPPVCRILDWGKYRYEQKKKEKQNKGKTKEVKEIRISFRISQHDLENKLKNAKKFLEKNHKVKIILFLKGREITKNKEAQEKLKNVALMLEEFGEIEEGPKNINPKLIYLVIKPKREK